MSAPSRMPEPEHHAHTLTPYAESDLIRSLWQLTSSLVAFGVLWYLAARSLDHSYALSLGFSIPAAVLMVRLFIIQHDCGHRSFFTSRFANDAAGSLLGIVTLTPYAYWRRAHAVHHATSGNLDKRGFGDIHTLTVKEYLAMGRWSRWRYRIGRGAFFIVVVGPAYQFFIKHRLPVNVPLAWKREWTSILVTNLLLVGVAFALSMTVGLKRSLLIQIPISWIASSIGVWLFYVQHQFENAYWQRDRTWNFKAAGLAGSSYYDLPAFLHWCTGNIGFHHIHHLCPRIPNYRLSACCRAHPELARATTRLSLAESMRCLRFKLWDEDQEKLVTFADVRLFQS